jgi:hypothetical protein
LNGLCHIYHIETPWASFAVAGRCTLIQQTIHTIFAYHISVLI